MHLSGESGYLVVRTEILFADPTVAIYKSYEEALKDWTSGTRISPIFSVTDAPQPSPIPLTFEGDAVLYFVGPVAPDLMVQHIPVSCNLWLTLGTYNVLASANHSEAAEVDEALAELAVAHEKWVLHNGAVRSATGQTVTKDGLSKVTAPLFAPELPTEIYDAAHEYAPLVSAALARARSFRPDLAGELESIINSIHEFVQGLTPQMDPDVRYRVLDHLITVTCGLRRLGNQALAGTSPILQTSARVASHSLLGIGLASLAICNVRRFLDATLGRARLPQRFARLGAMPSPRDLRKQLFPDEDVLGQINLDPDEEADPIVPLITYFSSRDGYRATATTLSAPLAAVACCNCPRWSLVTLTHEVSHVVIRAIQSELFPDFEKSEDVERCIALVYSDELAPTYLDELRRLVVVSIIEMDKASSGHPIEEIQLSSPILVELLQRWRRDVDEVMVHTFDLLHFYGRDVDKYVRGIWTSWGTIPNVRNRIFDYTVRTVSAVTAKHLRRGSNAESLARDEVIAALRALDGEEGGRYVNDALETLEHNWESVIAHVRARRQLVKIVTYVLFSPSVATALRGDSSLGPEVGGKEGYRFRVRQLHSVSMRNPLRFLEHFTVGRTASPIDSAWMLYVLAFGSRSDE